MASQGAPVVSSVATVLDRLGLGQYAQAFHAAGFTSLGTDLGAEQLGEMAVKVGMKPGHKMKFVKVLAERQPGTELPPALAPPDHAPRTTTTIVSNPPPTLPQVPPPASPPPPIVVNTANTNAVTNINVNVNQDRTSGLSDVHPIFGCSCASSNNATFVPIQLAPHQQLPSPNKSFIRTGGNLLCSMCNPAQEGCVCGQCKLWINCTGCTLLKCGCDLWHRIRFIRVAPEATPAKPR